MATRRERVVLDLEDNFSAGMARAAASAALLERNLNSLSGSAVRTDRDNAKVEKSVRSMGASSEASGKQIDRLSGRLALLSQAAAVLGPALIPLGAPAIGAIAGLAAQFASLAGGVGVAVLALNGMGDGLKAINAYQLEPTAENLQAMRIEMEKLGPAGASFAKYLDGLSSELSTLQMAAREGLLPGAQEGIESLMTMLPRVRSIITDLSEAMGGLASDAGAGLAGPGFERFFRYLDTEAGPLLTEFGKTIGNFTQGLANMFVGFGPLTDAFSGGLLEMSRSFAEWSSTLDSNQSFQGLLDYISESGPKAIDFLGQLAQTFGSILSAAAPVGDVVLPALTSLLGVIGDLADSPLGPLFFTAAAALSVYSRGAALADLATKRLGISAATSATQVTRSSAMYASAARGAGVLANNYGKIAAGAGMLALSMTDVDEKAGISNTAMFTLAGTMAGPLGAAAGFAVGATMDLSAANDNLTASVERAYAAMRDGTPKQQQNSMRQLKADVEATDQAITDLWDRDTTGENLFQQIGGDIAATWRGLGAVIGGGSSEGKFAIEQLNDAMRQGGGLADIFGADMGMTAEEIRGATSAARDFSGALAQMSGWLDKREALRSYQEELKNFGKALENGFQPKNVEGLDRVANGILQVASQIKNVEVRKDFMANARTSLEKFAETGPKARAAVDKVIDQFVKLGLMSPKPKIDVDTKGADGKLSATGRSIRALDGQSANPKVSAETKAAQAALGVMNRALDGVDKKRPNPVVTAETSGAMANLRGVLSALGMIQSKTVTVTTRTVRTGSGYGPQSPTETALGGFVPKTGLPYADRHHYLLADGEGVTTNKNGETDRFRDVVSGINAGLSRKQIKGMLADGGFAGGRIGFASSNGDNWSGMSSGIRVFNDNLQLSGEFLRNELRERVKLLEKEKEANKSRLDAIKAERDSLMESVRSRLTSNIWERRAATEFERPDNWNELTIQGSRPSNWETMTREQRATWETSNPVMTREQQLAWQAENDRINAFQQGSPADALKADIARAREMAQLLKQLKAKGLDGQAFTELAANGDIDQIRAYASGSAADLAQYERLYNQRSQVVNQTAGVAAMASGLTGEFRAARAEFRESNAELRQANQRLERAIKQAEKVEAAVKKVGKDVGEALDKPGARAGRR